MRLSPLRAVMGIQPACGDRQEGYGWGSVMETGAAEDEEVPMVVTAVDGAFAVSPAAPPGWFLRSAPVGSSLPQRLVLVTEATGGSECQVTFRVGWQLLGFSGIAKCGILATKGLFLLLDQIWFFNSFDAEHCSYPGRARAWVYRGHHPRWLLLCCSHGGSEQIKHCWGRLLQGHCFSERL